MEAGKHVLLRDPLSTQLNEFVEQLEFAERHHKFVQFSTTFVHQYRVRRFMDRVVREELFGRIHSIEAKLQLSYDDVEKVGVKLPLGPEEGCIRVLGRFCVLVSALIFARVGSVVFSAQVHNYQVDDNGCVIAAECTIKFTEVSRQKCW